MAAIDVLVATAGGFATGNIHTTKSSDIAWQFQLNFETAYHIAKPVFRHMMKRAAAGFSSSAHAPGVEERGGKDVMAYALSKSLLVKLTQMLNEEAKGTNVVTSPDCSLGYRHAS